MSVRAMGSDMPEVPPGTHWGKGQRQLPTAEQTAFSFDAQARLESDQTQLRALFCAAVRTYGGVDALTAALNREPSYAKKIADACNGYGDRKVQLDWFAPLLTDPACFDLFMGWLCERGGYAAPVRDRKVTREQIAAEATAVVAEMDAIVKDGVRKEVARRLGVRVEDVKL